MHASLVYASLVYTALVYAVHASFLSSDPFGRDLFVSAPSVDQPGLLTVLKSTLLKS